MDYIMLFNAKKSNPSPLALLLKKRKLLKMKTLYLQAMINANGSGGEWGKGAGKGGGSGGSIREAGGSFEKMEAARKELYVRMTQIQELAKLIKSHEISLSQYRGLFQHHVEAIYRLIQELQSQEAMKDKDSTQQGCNNANGSGGEWGKGAGKGGGSGGSIREAGGSFEKMEAARKELYVRMTQIQELAKLIKSHEIKLSQYRELFLHHVDAIDRLIQELQSQEAMKDKDSTQE